MNKIYHFTCYTLIIVFFLSCATTVPHEETARGRLDSLIGKPYKYAIMDLGPYTNIYDDGDGGRVLAWEQSTTQTTPGASYSSGSANISGQNIFASGMTISRPPTTYNDTYFTQVFVRPDSTIYHYRTNMRTKQEREAAENSKKLKQTGYTFLIIGVVMGVVLAAMSAEEKANSE